jgi:transposase InsO family protein
MKQEGLCGRQNRRYRVQTTNSNHDQPIAPNHLAKAPKASSPNQLWVADITYIETTEGCFTWPPSWTSTAVRSLAGP